MPSLNAYKNLLGVKTNGQATKYDAAQIVENTWYDDLASVTGYLYDWYRDSYKTVNNNLKPQTDSNKIPIEVKYIVNSSQSFGSNAITYHIQLKPSQECNVPYYFNLYEKIYTTEFPIGLYIDLPDSKGIYNKWLIVACANSNDPQFPTYEILRCNYILNVIINNKKYNISSIIRLQNSYNSGVYNGSILEVLDDKQKFIIPINRDFEYIYYNQRLLLDNAVLTEPKSWKISKIDRITYRGVCIVTLVQDVFDEHNDYVELDEFGNVVGLWADYYSNPIVPTNPEEDKKPNIHSEITYSGLKSEIKIGGSYKKFTVTFYEGDEESEFRYGVWKYTIDGEDASDLITTLDSSQSSDIKENQIKVKFIGSDKYLGKILNIKYISDIDATLDVVITSL